MASIGRKKPFRGIFPGLRKKKVESKIEKETNQVGKQASTSDTGEQENWTARQNVGANARQEYHKGAGSIVNYERAR